MFNYGYLASGKEKSNPESPTALDIQLHVKRNNGDYEYISNTTPFNWLFEHMASYGYIVRYPTDKEAVTRLKLRDQHKGTVFIGTDRIVRGDHSIAPPRKRSISQKSQIH